MRHSASMRYHIEFWDKMEAISQTTFWNAFSWMKMFEFLLKCNQKFVLKGPIHNIPALV